MTKWAIGSAAAAVVLFGCGGHGGGSAPNGGGPGRASAARVTLNNRNGLVYLAFLTGQGRAEGDLYMNITHADLSDEFGLLPRDVNSPLSIHLADFTLQYARIPGIFTGLGNVNSRNFDFFTLDPYSFSIETGGVVNVKPGDPNVINSYVGLPQQIPIRLRVFPGRDNVLPLFVNDAMFTTDGSTVTFNYAQFQAVNMPSTSESSTSNKVVGYLSDYVRFDLTHLTGEATPTLKLNGQPATHVYFSGDGYAISDDTPGSPRSNFEYLTQDPRNPLDGFMAPPQSSQSQQLGFPGYPGTYDLRQANPTDLTGNSKITSLFGRWRESSEVLDLTQTTFDIIVFPNSGERYSDVKPADAVAMVHQGNTITAFYWGYAFFTSNTAGVKPSVHLFPIANIATGDVSGEIIADLSGYQDASGAATNFEPAVRSGTYTFETGQTLPTGFLNTGTFIVFR